jgi:ribonuclease-3
MKAPDFARLNKILGHEFASPHLLREALTHASAVPASLVERDYERLEFLGDRVLGLVVADLLLKNDWDAAEGALAVRLNAIVRRESLADAARAAGLGRFVWLGKSEVMADGGPRESILADVFESIIGALFLDAGLKPAAKFIETNHAAKLAGAEEFEKDAKSKLQEIVQGRGNALPRYDMVDRSGPDHAPVFAVEVVITHDLSEEHRAIGTGASKRAAEQAAAEKLLQELEK